MLSPTSANPVVPKDDEDDIETNLENGLSLGGTPLVVVGDWCKSYSVFDKRRPDAFAKEMMDEQDFAAQIACSGKRPLAALGRVIDIEQGGHSDPSDPGAWGVRFLTLDGRFHHTWRYDLTRLDFGFIKAVTSTFEDNKVKAWRAELGLAPKPEGETEARLRLYRSILANRSAMVANLAVSLASPWHRLGRISGADLVAYRDMVINSMSIETVANARMKRDKSGEWLLKAVVAGAYDLAATYGASGGGRLVLTDQADGIVVATATVSEE